MSFFPQLIEAAVAKLEVLKPSVFKHVLTVYLYLFEFQRGKLKASPSDNSNLKKPSTILNH